MKNFDNLIRVVLFICLSISLAKGQSSVQSETKSSIIEHAKHNLDSDFLKENKLYKIFDFGSYMEASTNTLNIVPKNQIVYSKAELLHSESNNTVKSLDLTKEMNSIDLTGVPQGNYRLILSNEKGNVNVEKLTIL